MKNLVRLLKTFYHYNSYNKIVNSITVIFLRSEQGSAQIDRIGKIDPIHFFREAYRWDLIFPGILPIRSNFFGESTDPIQIFSSPIDPIQKQIRMCRPLAPMSI